MATEPRRVYWDSCVFIDALRKTDGRIDPILDIERKARAGQLLIFTSALAVAEVVKLDQHTPLTEDERRHINAYFRHKFVRVVPVDRIVAKSAADIVRVHELKPPDAVHVATALRCVCKVLFTFDGISGDPKKMLAKSDLIGTPTIPIKQPGHYGDWEMFSSGLVP